MDVNVLDFRKQIQEWSRVRGVCFRWFMDRSQVQNRERRFALRFRIRTRFRMNNLTNGFGDGFGGGLKDGFRDRIRMGGVDRVDIFLFLNQLCPLSRSLLPR
jgi:hypothetical protein